MKGSAPPDPCRYGALEGTAHEPSRSSVCYNPKLSLLSSSLLAQWFVT